jgi:hypothetical protein
MKRISSSLTFFRKRIVPVLWIPVMGLFAATAVSLKGENASVAQVVIACFLSLLTGGYFLWMFKRVWPLADVVGDCDDFLVVKKSGLEERLQFAEVYTVRGFSFGSPWPLNPLRVTLVLRTPGPFGSEISFWAKSPLFSRPDIVEDLNSRIDASRAGEEARRRLMVGGG